MRSVFGVGGGGGGGPTSYFKFSNTISNDLRKRLQLGNGELICTHKEARRKAETNAMSRGMTQ